MNEPPKKPRWNGDQVWIVIPRIRQYSSSAPSCMTDSSFFMLTFRPDATMPDSVRENCS